MQFEHEASVPHPQFDATGFSEQTDVRTGTLVQGHQGNVAAQLKSLESHIGTLKHAFPDQVGGSLPQNDAPGSRGQTDLRNGDFFCSWAWMEGEGSYTTEMSVVPCW